MQITTGWDKLSPIEIEKLIHVSKQLLPNNSDSAINIVYFSLQASIQADYQAGIDSSLSIMSSFWYKAQIENERYSLLEATVKLAESLDRQDKNIALLHYISGYYLLRKGLYTQAMLQQQKALEALPLGSNQKVIMTIKTLIYDQLGSIWILLQEPNQAMIWWNKAEDIARSERDMHRLIRILRNKGTFYYNNKQFDTSYALLMDAYNLAKESPEIHMHCGCVRFTVSALCLTLLGQNKPDEALAYLNEEIEYATEPSKIEKGPKSESISGDLLHLYFMKGYAYYEQKKYKQAKEILLPTLTTAQKQQAAGTERNILGLLSMLNGAIGRYKEAYEYLRLYNDREKEMVNDQKASAVDFHIQYLKSEKDKELAQKHLLLTRQQAQIKNKNILIGGTSAIIILLCTLFIVVYYNIRRRQALKQELIQLQSIMKGEEKERARLAYELHDGIVIQFSAVKMNLSTLPNKHTGLTSSKEYHGIIQSLDNATRDLRKTAHHLMPDMLLEEGLVEATFYFCRSLMKNAALEIDFQHYGDLPRLDPEFELSVYRILQELVQNIAKHAAATWAMVQLSFSDEVLHITVEDNGKGFDQNNPQITDGMGLKSIRSRVKVLNGQFSIDSRPGKGTMIYLEFDTSGIARV